MMKRKNRPARVELPAKERINSPTSGGDRKDSEGDRMRNATSTEEKCLVNTKSRGTSPMVEVPKAPAPSLASTPILTQMIEQRTFENGQLEMELRRQRQKYQASMYVVAEARRVAESLQQALINFQKLSANVEDVLPTGERKVQGHGR